ncbi:MAG: class I SAM-dependent methyltransferase [Woeseiaceae bacterium]
MNNTDKSAIDLPPPISEATQHDVYPDLNHDERARLNFLAASNKLVAATIMPANELAYEQRVLPAFEAQHGRQPKTRHEVRQALETDPFYQMWSALRRNSMEVRQQAGRALVLRQINELAEKAKRLNEDSDNLILDDSVEVPSYVHAVDHHCMPGSYYTELVDGDVSPAANYDVGFFATTGGTHGRLGDAPGRVVAQWIKTLRPDFKPRRILDIGVAAGLNLVPIAQAFPDCEVVAIDISAPMLRYAHARAKALGVTNIKFIQMSGEDLSAFDDERFDWVMTSVFLHELSAKSLPKILTESFRVLRKDGLNLHLEQPQYHDGMPLIEQALRDWDAYNNNEPFWSALHATNLDELLVKVGFKPDSIFHQTLHDDSDDELFPASRPDKEEYGRSTTWQFFGAWKT